jgi:hypothetical protein
MSVSLNLWLLLAAFAFAAAGSATIGFYFGRIETLKTIDVMIDMIEAPLKAQSGEATE